MSQSSLNVEDSEKVAKVPQNKGLHKVSMENMNESLQKDIKFFEFIKQEVEKNEEIWYYLDPKEEKQGPFRTDQIFSWRKEEYIDCNLPLSFKDQTG